MPYQVFISYRRSDSLTTTGRIYDRLAAAFGQSVIFKDMQDIHAGEDFRNSLKAAVGQAKVVLVIIGPQWLTVAEPGGQRRLDNPADFVRTEVEMALAAANMLVIPVLVEDATVPPADKLPEPLKNLAYRNALPIRQDPDFAHDMDTLIAQIKTRLAPARPAPPKSWAFALIAAAALVLLLIIGVLIRPLLVGTTAASASATSAPTALPTVAPVASGEFMVLVAQIQPLRNAIPRDVGGFITRDLTAILDKNSSFSKTRLRQYPAVITSDDQARTVATSVHAAVMVWGTYTDQAVTLYVQLGEVPFGANTPANMIPDRVELERIANVEIQLTDEQTQSIAAPVLAIQLMAQLSGGDLFESTRTLAMLYQYQSIRSSAPSELSFVNQTVGTQVHQAWMNFFFAPETAIAYLNNAIASDAANALLYTLRGYVYLQENKIDKVRADINAAKALPDGSTYPALYLPFATDWGNNQLSDAISDLTSLIALRPTDWYLIYLQGAGYYLTGDFSRAQAAINQSLALIPKANLPYVFAELIALREGRLADVGVFLAKSKRDFPDTTFGNLFIKISLGSSGAQTAFQALFSNFSLFILRQYQDVIDSSTKTLADVTITNQQLLADIYLTRGFAYCNQGDDHKAAADYTAGLKIDPDNVTLYLLRADSRYRLGDASGALQDINAAQTRTPSDNKAQLAKYAADRLTGQFTCKTTFDYLLNAANTPTPAAPNP